MDANELAIAVAKVMYHDDRCMRALGVEVLEVRPGFARLRMTVRTDMLNGIQITHGGMIFTLADAAFAFACNSHNRRAVAAGCSIEFLRASNLGDVLTATSVEQAVAGRRGVYDVRVEDQAGELVALFRGKSSQIGGAHVGGADADALR